MSCLSPLTSHLPPRTPWSSPTPQTRLRLRLTSETEGDSAASATLSAGKQDRRRQRRRRISPNSHLRTLLSEGREIATSMADVPMTPHAHGALAKQVAAGLGKRRWEVAWETWDHKPVDPEEKARIEKFPSIFSVTTSPPPRTQVQACCA